MIPPTHLVNELGQPIGAALPSWRAARRASRDFIGEGRFVRLEATSPKEHANGLFAANSAEPDGASWTYMAYGPFATLDSYVAWMEATCLGTEPVFFTIIDKSDRQPVGVASLLRSDPNAGVIEVGHIHYSARLQRTRGATEAMYVLGKYVFDELGYRRYEWKCDALNTPSRQAAARLGFSYEGTFRQATIYKGRNRDTAWFSMLDREWPTARTAFESWLDSSNFDPTGRQRSSLADLRNRLMAGGPSQLGASSTTSRSEEP